MRSSARDLPPGVTEQLEDRGHKGHADEEGVSKDAEGEAETDRLGDGVAPEAEAREDAGHDDCCRGDDAGAAAKAGDDRVLCAPSWTSLSRTRETRETW